jgi:hypothetical protein
MKEKKKGKTVKSKFTKSTLLKVLFGLIVLILISVLIYRFTRSEDNSDTAGGNTQLPPTNNIRLLCPPMVCVPGNVDKNDSNGTSDPRNPYITDTVARFKAVQKILSIQPGLQMFYYYKEIDYQPPYDPVYYNEPVIFEQKDPNIEFTDAQKEVIYQVLSEALDDNLKNRLFLETQDYESKCLVARINDEDINTSINFKRITYGVATFPASIFEGGKCPTYEESLNNSLFKNCYFDN